MGYTGGYISNSVLPNFLATFQMSSSCGHDLSRGLSRGARLAARTTRIFEALRPNDEELRVYKAGLVPLFEQNQTAQFSTNPFEGMDNFIQCFVASMSSVRMVAYYVRLRRQLVQTMELNWTSAHTLGPEYVRRITPVRVQFYKFLDDVRRNPIYQTD